VFGDSEEWPMMTMNRRILSMRNENAMHLEPDFVRQNPFTPGTDLN
jgi:hypothetical protein